jgi:hypothetical protein
VSEKEPFLARKNSIGLAALRFDAWASTAASWAFGLVPKIHTQPFLDFFSLELVVETVEIVDVPPFELDEEEVVELLRALLSLPCELVVVEFTYEELASSKVEAISVETVPDESEPGMGIGTVESTDWAIEIFSDIGELLSGTASFWPL